MNAEVEARLNASLVEDESCRFARLNPNHFCRNEDGSALREGSVCWYEARAQVQAAVEAVRAEDAQQRGPVNRWAQR